jgi:hypothetical protein
MEDNIAQKDKEVLDNFRSMSVGQIFVKARTSQNVEIGDVASHLNISTPHLEAIESDDKDAMPAKVYAVGFVRAYADLLGLDSEKMAYLFKKQIYGQNDFKRPDGMPQNHPRDKETSLERLHNKISDNLGVIAILIGLSSIIILIIGTIIWLLWPNGDDSSSIPPVSSVLEAPIDPLNNQAQFDPSNVQESPSEPMQLIIRPNEGSQVYGSEPLTSPLVFKAIEKSWIEILPVTGKEPLLSRTLEEGDVFYTPKDTDILLTTGNAGGIEVYLDGRKLGNLGDKSEIIRLRPFSAKALRLQLQQ